MMKFLTIILLAAALGTLGSCCSAPLEKKEASSLPNVILIYADDLGYGDVSAYGATEISTPHMDQLARGGVRFTNGYSTSATCSPSRYALLTGIYPWRNEQAKILDGTAPLLIQTDQITLPRMLRERGYHTGIVGKWHLGLGDGQVDWNTRLLPAPMKWDLIMPISWQLPRTGFQRFISKTAGWCVQIPMIPSRSPIRRTFPANPPGRIIPNYSK